MKRNLKKFISLLLSLIIIMSVMAVGFSAFAQDESVTADVTQTTNAQVEDEEENHPTFIAITIQFFKEIFNFFKYIFYDVFLGKPVPDIKPIV